MLERMDANRDGSITKEEFAAARSEMFGQRDRNGDGYLDSEDAGTRMTRRGGERMAEARERLDTDGDGRISKDEFVSADSPLFDTADKDSNGVLDAQEIADAKAAMQARKRERRAQ
jgi:Ca2+-binding EF-hand superfamily protein